jgi:ABC-type amino acid transport substrate-binding protein
VLQAMGTTANQERNLKLIEQGELDIYWSAASISREQALLAIKIPIYKGLFGYRLMLVKAENKNLLAGVRTIKDLKKFTIGQGVGWPDVEIYQHNRIKVDTTNEYANLFNMLALGRFDLFPRAVVEIWDEVELFKTLNLAVEENVLVHYPYAIYFYVKKDAQQLASIIETGFRRIIEEGEYDALFMQYHSNVIDKMNTQARVVIELDNPNFKAKNPDSSTVLTPSIH